MPTRIVIFAKAPLPGKAKTRLIPALGEKGAARLAHQMLLDTYREAAAVEGANVELCTTPEQSHSDWSGLLPPDADMVGEQGDGDLGERLARAAERVTSEGDRVIFIGTDCPDLTRSQIQAACRALEAHDAAIHPAFDGGYALLGLRRYDASIFNGIAWSTSTVTKDTIGRIEALGWSLHIGETLRDVDEPADLV